MASRQFRPLGVPSLVAAPHFRTGVGIHASHTIDSIATGLVVAAGTKPLHDFISLLQNQNNPETKTTVS